MLTQIDDFIKQKTADATKKLFMSFTGSSAYQNALMAAVTLMITFYAIGFTIGIVQPSFQQVLVRLVKMSIVVGLISPGGWDFFNNNVVQFFQAGTDDLIVKIQAVGLDGVTPPPNARPFWLIDNLVGFAINPETIIAIIGAFAAGGPYGLMMGGLMMIAITGFVKLAFNALKIYAISYVARAMILGVGPIFFVFLLFDRTKQMFISWLNALVNLALQPILLFTFMSFFLVMIENAAADMLNSELCWNDFQNVESSSNKLAFWRFVDKDTKKPATSEMDWMGSLECLLSSTTAGKCKPFPMEMIGVLSFLILIYICNRFTEIITKIASELSNALVALDSSGKFEQFLREQSKATGAGTVNKHQGVPKPPN